MVPPDQALPQEVVPYLELGGHRGVRSLIHRFERLLEPKLNVFGLPARLIIIAHTSEGQNA